MKKLYIFVTIMILHAVTYTAALIPPKISSKISKTTSNIAKKLLGEEKTAAISDYLIQGKYYWDLYCQSIIRPTEATLKKHSLWYGVKSGTTRSYTGEDPISMIEQYYIFMTNNWENNLTKENKQKFLYLKDTYWLKYKNYYLNYNLIPKTHLL